MPVFGDQEYPEETRLKYRFLDLRRDKLHQNIMTRGKVIDSIRRRMKEQGFFEFQTPILTASSPEGARDYLVPSRIHPGKFYALPQAPQQFKQLIMMSGFDRYFQIAPCFRDEDARADRSPGEFYQLDLEMSFVTQQDVFDAVEPVMRGVFEEFAGGKPVTPKFPMIPYAEAMRKYGSDKPDLRNPIEMQNVSEAFRGSGFKIFAGMLASDPKVEVWAIPAKGGGNRAFCDRMNAWAQHEGQPGLGYIFWREGEEGGAGPLAKNIGPERTKQIADQLGLGVGDAAFFIAGKPAQFVKFAGPARTKVGEELGLVKKDRFDFCWIVDFPMFEWNEEEKKIDFSHNPFSMPNMDVDEFLKLDAGDHDKILGIKAIQYDIVCNGVELSSGAIRNHRPDVMKKAFAIAGYDESVLEAEVRRHAARAVARRAAARRHRARHRPHRHAPVRRGEPARGGAVPDEPARRGPADGRALGGHAQAVARTAYQAEPAREEIDPRNRIAPLLFCLPVCRENSDGSDSRSRLRADDGGLQRRDEPAALRRRVAHSRRRAAAGPRRVLGLVARHAMPPALGRPDVDGALRRLGKARGDPEGQRVVDRGFRRTAASAGRWTTK